MGSKNTSINLKQSRIKSHQIYFQKPKVKVDELDNIIIMKNKTPIWNDSVNAYVLNFGGRVTKASIKNTILLPNYKPTKTHELKPMIGVLQIVP